MQPNHRRIISPITAKFPKADSQEPKVESMENPMAIHGKSVENATESHENN